jgi:hypothetical protein
MMGGDVSVKGGGGTRERKRQKDIPRGKKSFPSADESE